MIDWQEVSQTEDPDELRAAKIWLFQENMRLESERRELAAAREKFLSERVKLQRELDELNLRTVQERKRLKEETLFFDKKMAILQDGFRQLDLDRQEFERQKKSMAEARSKSIQQESAPVSENAVRRLFAGINNSLALRKRYRDLIKIFHPDNMFGDEELVQMINREYIKRKEEL
ncbi:MAG: hypothetical protein NC432_05900 [Roseburia sp.]|nr:hypothetical protein [Roseburia sp.]MCM1098838.1 hypothetical protein [Ruminococcus flavefaciens]